MSHRETIDNIRLHYRLAKAAEVSRIRMDHGLSSFVRCYLTAWTPAGEELTRTKANAQVSRVIDAIRDGEKPGEEDAALYAAAAQMVLDAEASRQAFEMRRKEHRKAAEKLASNMPGWHNIQHVHGFGIWGQVALIGEAGDIEDYSGCRKLFKRLGLAPNECYPKGEKSEGRKIPRNTRGRIMGIIADPLLRAQWRGEKEGAPAHAIGPFGQVYGDVKARRLAEGKPKGHAEKLARRTMVKALLHDVHAAWHGKPLMYAGSVPLADAAD